MRVQLGADLRVTDAPADVRAVLCKAATFPHPEYRKRVRLGRSVYGVPSQLLLWRQEGEWLIVPRGLAGLLPRAIVEDARAILPRIEFGWRGQLWPEQRQAALAAVRAGGGVVVGPCGSGKTQMGLACLSAWRQPTLWIVHTTDLARQALDRARQLFDLPPWAYGLLGAGSESMGSHLTVATVQTLARRDLGKLAGRFGAVVCDECHHTPSTTFTEVLQAFPARYRLGLTATPDRSDGLAGVMYAVMGGQVARLTVRQLAEAGRVLLPLVRQIRTGFRYPYTDRFQELMAALVADRPRNDLIAERIAAEARAGRRCLVLSERVWHCAEMARVLQAVAPDVRSAVLTHETKEKARAYVLRGIGQGGIPVVFATQLADEGLDIPAVDRLVLAAGGRAAGRVQQRVGRAMRALAGKDPEILDFVDGGPVLEAQARARAREVYGPLGLRVVREDGGTAVAAGGSM